MAKEAKDIPGTVGQFVNKKYEEEIFTSALPLDFQWIFGYKVVNGRRVAITKEEAAELDKKAKQRECP